MSKHNTSGNEKQIILKITGMEYYKSNFINSLSEDPMFDCTKNELIDWGYEEGDIIYKYEKTLITEGIMLVPEPTNKHDANAIKCEYCGRVIGYVRATQTKRIRKYLDDNSVLTISIEISGGPYKRIIYNYDDDKYRVERDKYDLCGEAVVTVKEGQSPVKRVNKKPSESEEDLFANWNVEDINDEEPSEETSEPEDLFAGWDDEEDTSTEVFKTMHKPFSVTPSKDIVDAIFKKRLKDHSTVSVVKESNSSKKGSKEGYSDVFYSELNKHLSEEKKKEHRTEEEKKVRELLSTHQEINNLFNTIRSNLKKSSK